MRLRDDSGQSTIEWLALMAMLVALGGLLVAVFPDLGHAITDAFAKLIRHVVG
jgi:Flp pilus assembly pilin Flp